MNFEATYMDEHAADEDHNWKQQQYVEVVGAYATMPAAASTTTMYVLSLMSILYDDYIYLMITLIVSRACHTQHDTCDHSHTLKAGHLLS